MNLAITRFTIPVLALALAPMLAAATDGALEINQDCIFDGCFAGDVGGYPITITHPGSYILTSDLAAPGTIALNAITISASPVDIDLNGHTINGGASCSGNPVTSCTTSTGRAGIEAGNAGLPGVFHIHNGTVRGFSLNGILLNDAGDGTVLDHLSVLDTAGIIALSIDGGPGTLASVRVRDSQIAHNASYGINTQVTPVRLFIENSVLAGNRYAGASLTSGGVLTGNRINDNGAGTGGGYRGVECSADCTLGQNTFQNNNGGGANPQFAITTLRDMGGNVCVDTGTCP